MKQAGRQRIRKVGGVLQFQEVEMKHTRRRGDLGWMNRLFLKEESHRVEEPSHNHDERIRFVLSLLQTPALLHSGNSSLTSGFCNKYDHEFERKRCMKAFEVNNHWIFNFKINDFKSQLETSLNLKEYNTPFSAAADFFFPCLPFLNWKTRSVFLHPS